jgi:HPt (histidine-containing phosphotransfer) domain-containing protein
VGTIDPEIVLDREQLQLMTLHDPQLMREIMGALIEDTSRQAALLDVAIRAGDAHLCVRLAHNSRGACGNCGANAAAAALFAIERSAASGEFEKCRESLAALSQQVERLRAMAEEM